MRTVRALCTKLRQDHAQGKSSYLEELKMEAHNDDVSLGTNTQEDHLLLLQEFFTVCREIHLCLKREECEFMKEEMECLGFDVGYGWWQ